MRHLLMLAVLCCFAACKSNNPPPPSPGGVNVDAPFVHIRTGSDGPAVNVNVPSQPLPPPVTPAH
jgi:hypothetical protein